MKYNDTFYDGIDVELTNLSDGTPRLVHLTFHDSRNVEFKDIIGVVARDLAIAIIGHDHAEFNSWYFQIGDILCQYYYTEESVEDILYYSTLEIVDLIIDHYHIKGEGLFTVLHAVESALRASVEYRMH